MLRRIMKSIFVYRGGGRWPGNWFVVLGWDASHLTEYRPNYALLFSGRSHADGDAFSISYARRKERGGKREGGREGGRERRHLGHTALGASWLIPLFSSKQWPGTRSPPNFFFLSPSFPILPFYLHFQIASREAHFTSTILS